MQQEQIILQVRNTVRAPSGEHYVIEELLGKGGFGAVYLVRERHHEQKVFALKEVINPSPRDHHRFTSEAELLKRLEHRALPHVYFVFENEQLKRVYMLMDYVQGRNLEVLLAEQPGQHFSLPLALTILTPIVDALRYMHQQVPPVVHRDLKPANIIVSLRGEEAVLVDFGLAKEYVSDKTTSIIRHGSPGYAALEHYAHGGTTPRTDIYGLAATLYTMLTGTVPIDAVSRITRSKGFDPLEPVNLLNPEVPAGVAKVLQRAMSISMDDRFKTVEEFWQEMRASAAEQQADTPDITAHTSQSVVLRLPQPLTVTERELTPVTTTLLQKQHHTPLFRKRAPLLSVVLSLLFMGVLSISFLLALLWHGTTTSPSKGASHAPLAASTAPPTRTSPHTPPPDSSLFPTLAPSYSGTIAALIANKKTTLFLTNIQQNQGNMQGTFKGLALVGPFRGTMSPSGHLQFTVTIYGGTSTLAFEGDIKIGGDLVGTYQVLDQSGQRTGESGLWDVSPGS